MTSSILVGDVGGTSVRFALAHRGAEGISIEDFVKLPGDDFKDFEDAVAAYVDRLGARPAEALFALAGPVKDDVVRLTNRNWAPISARELEARLGFHQAHLVNDFAAMARAVPELPAADFETILPGRAAFDAPVLVTGPGTGFGVATLLPDPRCGWKVITGEGGHAAFAPRSDRECELAAILRAEHNYVSTELVVSGQGLPAVQKAMSTLHGVAYTPMSPADVFAGAASGDPVCREICEMRADATLGAVGDLALINGTLGGVVLTGGVAQRLHDYLKRPSASDRFRERGPQTAYLADVGVRLITTEMAPLIGAAALHYDLEASA